AGIAVMGKAAREALRLVVGHRCCRFPRVYVLSAGARLSCKRALRAAADAPARCGDRDARCADRARGRVAAIRGGDGAGLLIVAQAAGHRIAYAVARLREVRIAADAVDARGLAAQE